MTSRYCNCPMVFKKLGRRITLMDRIRRWLRKEVAPDVYPICDYNPPVYPSK